MTEPNRQTYMRWGLPLLLAIAAGVGGWLAFSSADPLKEAIAQVRDGEQGACETLQQTLSQHHRDHPGGFEAPAGFEEAVGRCISEQLKRASAASEPRVREQQLLLVADPEAVLQPSPEQLVQIEQAADALPGALIEGKPRIRVRSVEVVGALATRSARQLFRDYRVQLRACHAKAQQEAPALAGDYRVGLEVDAQGVVTKVQAKPGKLDSPQLQRCLVALFEGKRLDAGGRVTVELRLRPFGE